MPQIILPMLDKYRKIHYNILAIGVWRSLVSRLVRVQEASGSNPDTPTKNLESAEADSRFFIDVMGFERPFKKHAGGMFLGRGRIHYSISTPLWVWIWSNFVGSLKPHNYTPTNVKNEKFRLKRAGFFRSCISESIVLQSYYVKRYGAPCYFHTLQLRRKVNNVEKAIIVREKRCITGNYRQVSKKVSGAIMLSISMSMQINITEQIQ